MNKSALNQFKLTDIISTNDLLHERYEYVLKLRSKRLKKIKPCKETGLLLKNKVIGSHFFEPSTRTRLSFELQYRI